MEFSLQNTLDLSNLKIDAEKSGREGEKKVVGKIEMGSGCTWNLRFVQVLIAQIQANSVHTSEKARERCGRGRYGFSHWSLAAAALNTPGDLTCSIVVFSLSSLSLTQTPNSPKI